MKRQGNSCIVITIVTCLIITSCTSSSNSDKEIVGKYASQGENNFYYFKDTIEVRPTDDGKFDIQTLSNWSTAKTDDPQRPSKNKIAGVWNNYGPGDIEVAALQESDHTLRITEPMTGTVKILVFDPEKKTITQTSKDGEKTVYHKIQ